MTDFYDRSLIIHERLHGKVGTIAKVALETKDDLAIVYTPGVARPCEAIASDPSRVRD